MTTPAPDLDDLRRRRGCDGKVQHRTKRHARNAVRNMERHSATAGPPLHAYHCRYCGWWHVGHARSNGDYATALSRRRTLTLPPPEPDVLAGLRLALEYQLVTIESFARLVADMREAQRNYFRAMPQTVQKQAALDDSKRLERRVDLVCRELLQPSLFANRAVEGERAS